MSDPSSGTAARDQDSGLPARGGDARIDRPTSLTRAEKDELLRKIMLLLTVLTLAFVFVLTARQATSKLIEFTDLPAVGK